MSYVAYKRAFWPLMLAAWELFATNYPESGDFSNDRIAFAQQQIAEWSSPEKDKRYPA